MMNRLICVSLLAATLGLITACGTKATPASQMADADQAMVAKDYQKALDLYDGLVDWKGDGKVQPGERFKAELSAVRCLIGLKRPEDGVARFKKMYETFPTEMADANAYKNVLTVWTALDQENAAPAISIDLLTVATEKHAAQKEKFGKVVERLKNQPLSNDEIEALKKLGYL